MFKESASHSEQAACVASPLNVWGERPLFPKAVVQITEIGAK